MDLDGLSNQVRNGVDEHGLHCSCEYGRVPMMT